VGNAVSEFDRKERRGKGTLFRSMHSWFESMFRDYEKSFELGQMSKASIEAEIL